MLKFRVVSPSLKVKKYLYCI